MGHRSKIQEPGRTMALGDPEEEPGRTMALGAPVLRENSIRLDSRGVWIRTGLDVCPSN